MPTRRPLTPIGVEGRYVPPERFSRWRRFWEDVDTVGFACLLLMMYPVARVYVWIRGIKW